MTFSPFLKTSPFFRLSSSFKYRSSWLFSILATPSNWAARARKPSSSAVLAISAYMRVHSSFSPAAAATRFSSVEPMPSRALNHSLACSFSFRAVSWKMAAICS